MIGWLRGRIVDKHQPGKLVMDVNGVGYDVETSLSTFFQLVTHEDMISLHIHTIVREDALILYGFLDKNERALFRALIKVNGIGPKSAIAILSSMTPEEFISCIQNSNIISLTKLPGIGKKTAERLLIEMKDSIQSLSLNMPIQVSLSSMHQRDEAISALEALGYKRIDAVKVVQKVDTENNKTCEQLIREALRVLSS